MRKFLIVLLFLFFSVSLFSQKLGQVQFSGGANLTSLAIITDQKIIIKISLDGKILEWGNEMEKGRVNYQPGSLQPYMGRVDYWGKTADSAYREKVKSIGTSMIVYYGYNDDVARVGKIKSIGSLKFDYYTDVVNKSLRGKIKTMGYDVLSYYSDHENESIRSKIKSIGNSNITYYSSFDDVLIRGKIKSIGQFSYTWYTSFDRREYQGQLKTGSYNPIVNGVSYLLR